MPLELYIESSSIDSICAEAGLFSTPTIRQIFRGKSCKCGIEYHITNVLACHELIFEAASQDHGLDELLLKCQELGCKLHARDPTTNIVFDEISSHLSQIELSSSMKVLGN